MPYPEADLLPISALQHVVFCERQAALIHVERLWVENRLTAEGQRLHQKAHAGKPETRDGERVERGLPLRSLRLGLTGVADVVLYRPPDDATRRGLSLSQQLRRAGPDVLRRWVVQPVEYKRGRPKRGDADRVQLCAQAICLEETHGVEIPHGALFYGKTRRRHDVEFDDRLRAATRDAAERFRQIIATGSTPPAVYEKKCDTCSLLPLCLPRALDRKSAKRFFERQLANNLAEDKAPSEGAGP